MSMFVIFDGFPMFLVGFSSLQANSAFRSSESGGKALAI